MKKILAAIILGVMIFTIGCGSSNSDEVNHSENIVTEQIDTDDNKEVIEISMEVLNNAEVTDKTSFQYFLNDDGGYTISEYYGNEAIVVIPDEIEGIAVTYIASGVFSGSEILEAIKIGDNITSLESKAFLNCSNLKYVILGDKVKSIGEHCFSGSVLEDIKLNDGLEKLEYCSLYAKTLKTITIPSSVIEIDAAFATSTVVHVRAGSYAETYMKEEIEKYPDAGYEYIVD